MNDEIVNGADHPKLIRECISLAASDPKKNILLLADLFPPHLDLSDLYIELRKGRIVDFSTVYRGFPNPSVVLGVNASKSRLLDYILSNLKGDFTCIFEPKEMILFEGKATIVDQHNEYQMILEKLAEPKHAMVEGKLELVHPGEVGKLDHFLKQNAAYAWLPVQFRCGPYYCIKLADEIVSVAGVHFVTPQIAQLGNIVTDKLYRRRGFATHTIYALASTLHSKDRSISLFVAEDNKQAIWMYEKIGFQKMRKLTYATLHTLRVG